MQRTPREDMELEIMGYLNENRMYYGAYYDCGDLGILHIYWSRSTWETEWIEIQPWPVLVQK